MTIFGTIIFALAYIIAVMIALAALFGKHHES